MNNFICNLLGTDKITGNEIFLVFMSILSACCVMLIICFSGILGF